jgi:hypothetical protein
MRSLSKEAEQKLISAIERAATLVNAGSSPNDAIVKSASEANVPAGHINLMVHAYNTGRTTKQREQGDDVTEKAADFQLADADAVLESLYPKQVKTSSELLSESIVSTEYAVSPAGFLARRNASLEKTAAAQYQLPAKTFVPPPRDEKFAAERAYSQKVSEKRASEETRRIATMAYQKAADAMDTLHDYFRKPGHMSFGDALREVDLRLGAEGVSVLNKLAAVYPHLEKQAATGETHLGLTGPYSLVTNVLDAVDAYNAAKSNLDAVKQASVISKKEAPTFITGSILYNPLEEPLTLKSAAPDSKKKDSAPAPTLTSFGGTMAGLGKLMGGGAIADQADRAVASTDPLKLKQKAYASIAGPDHENRLQQIKSRGVLNDLILNDPVISGYEPHEVASAYNQLAELAPNFTSSSAAMQALLRKRLESGGLADFDVKQLVELEKLRAESAKSTLEAQQKARELL